MIVDTHTVKNNALEDGEGQLLMFTPVAKTMQEVKVEQRQTIQQRCEKAVEVTGNQTSVYWCNLNDESSLLKELDKDAIEIKGSMNIDKKEEILFNFAEQKIKRIITKAKITGMGLNWQHCNHSVYFPTWSYEQYYQACRRFWRFGQKKKVNIKLVISDGQTRVIESLKQKTKKAIDLYENLVKNTNSNFEENEKEFNKKIIKPKF